MSSSYNILSFILLLATLSFSQSHQSTGWIMDNQITANKNGGIYAEAFATVTITANRIEWNRNGGIVLKPLGVNTLQITACTFDRNYGPGISIVNPNRSSNNTEPV